MSPPRDDELHPLETRVAVHEAVCAERYGKILDRVAHVEVVLYAIVVLLLVGEGSVIDVLRRVFG